MREATLTIPSPLNASFPLTLNFATSSCIFQYPIQDDVSLMSLFLLAPFNLVTPDFCSLVDRGFGAGRGGPSLSSSRSWPWGCLEGISQRGGLVFRTSQQRQRRPCLRLGSWETPVHYFGEPCHLSYSSPKADPRTPRPASRGGEAGITELGLFTMSTHRPKPQ